MFCNQCGEENRNDRKFCLNCGAPLKDYTKPVENTINPEEIEEKQKIVEKKNKVNDILKILSISFVVVAIILSILSFAAGDNFVMPILIIALICYFVSLVLYITKSAMYFRTKKKINQNNVEQEENKK